MILLSLDEAQIILTNSLSVLVALHFISLITFNKKSFFSLLMVVHNKPCL